MINYIYIYIFINLTVIFHELGHLIMAIYFDFKKIEVSLGEELFQFKLKNFKISPFIYKGYVSFELEEKIKKHQLFFFYFGSIYYQILLEIIFILYLKTNTLILLASGINSAYIIFSLLPFGKSDMKMFLDSKKNIK